MGSIIDTTNTSEEQGKPFLKSGSYSLRCLQAEFKHSAKTKNPMLAFTYEIVAPEKVFVTETVSGQPTEVERKITGLQVRDWLVFGGDAIGRATTKLRALNTFTGQPLKMDIEDKTVLAAYRGKAIRVRLRSEGSVVKDENTGEPILDGQGNPINDVQYRINEIVGADDANTIPTEAMPPY